MKKRYGFARTWHQHKLSLTGTIIWLFLGAWPLLNSWHMHQPVQTPLLILPLNMIVLTGVYGYLQNKTAGHAPPNRQLLILLALLLIALSAFWVYAL